MAERTVDAYPAALEPEQRKVVEALRGLLKEAVKLNREKGDPTRTR